MKTDILGIKVDVLTKQRFFQKIEESISSGDSCHIAYLNADCVNHAFADKEYQQILDKVDILYADGMSIVRASRLTDSPLRERLTAADILPEFCKLCAAKGYKIFMLGSEDGAAEKAAKNLKRDFEGLRIAGFHHGFFKEDEDIKEMINSAQPDILMVGMGVPKQEKWIAENKEALNVPVIWGVGALFEYYSGRARRAPVWMRKAGLEWLFRLMLNPRRFWKRYLIGNFLFLWRVFLWRVKECEVR